MGREERGVKRGFVGMEERGEEHIGGSGEERGGREGREESHGGREEERRELWEVGGMYRQTGRASGRTGSTGFCHSAASC